MHLATERKSYRKPKNWQVQGFQNFQMSLLTVQIHLLFLIFWQFLHMFHGKSPPTRWPLHPRCSRQHYMSPRWLPSPRTSIPAVHGFSVSRSWWSQKDFLELPRGKMMVIIYCCGTPHDIWNINVSVCVCVPNNKNKNLWINFTYICIVFYTLHLITYHNIQRV